MPETNTSFPLWLNALVGLVGVLFGAGGLGVVLKYLADRKKNENDLTVALRAAEQSDEQTTNSAYDTLVLTQGRVVLDLQARMTAMELRLEKTQQELETERTERLRAERQVGLRDIYIDRLLAISPPPPPEVPAGWA